MGSVTTAVEYGIETILEVVEEFVVELEVADSARGIVNTHIATSDVKVPGSGQLYLSWGAPSSSLVELPIPVASVITRLTVRVDVADAAKDYDFVVLGNGVPIATLTLDATDITDTENFAVAVAAGTALSVRAERATGSGASDFRAIVFTLEITEA